MRRYRHCRDVWPDHVDHRPSRDDRLGSKSELRHGGRSCGTGTPPTAVCDSVEGGGGVGHPFWRRISNSIHYQSPVSLPASR